MIEWRWFDLEATIYGDVQWMKNAHLLPEIVTSNHEPVNLKNRDQSIK
jgi:hypothetical protein